MSSLLLALSRLCGANSPHRTPPTPHDPRPRPLQSAGDLLLFCGNRSIHRVTPVVGPRPRLLAVLAYDLEPGKVLNEYTRMKFYGR